ncbi:pantoate--beta-alanine ligase [Legionella jordanis]|uniref:Pantothenate synthetase n=1 Tax=Legionella jordanis TaxID=456 RepID=A0A0W0VDH3_9GAMM|nr:pantoate--beta-alanine ligase [Legionella jordanis]KTD18158.1 pantothenate synthetase [Legionella jordanis]RMX01120.1 pantoate--beta-alanine ligase [Legionella jordanis]RMX21350.1 pantoate--beta-alanine ligase [Legionella jordanis]VEH13749.1 pantothenate synthetase [Legionella jordanis]HAT8714540.1 pantoate--beta-alanine ligase [Legionella jordanis]
MQIFHTLNEWQSARRALSFAGTIGFVPTMGNLHKGHASLIQNSKEENDITVVSIFINPTQFNRAEDLEHYPRTLNADLDLLKSLDVDYCLLPTEEEIYKDQYSYQIVESELSQIMEGKYRPGHFTGVLTVVMKLFNLVKPSQAYFGEKDFQQYQLIKKMAEAFFMDVAVKACPTVREQSGLAYSSRNNRLDKEGKLKAEQFARLFHQNKSCEDLKQDLRESNIHVEYLESHHGRRYAAVTIADIRLIDNYLEEPI